MMALLSMNISIPLDKIIVAVEWQQGKVVKLRKLFEKICGFTYLHILIFLYFSHESYLGPSTGRGMNITRYLYAVAWRQPYFKQEAWSHGFCPWSQSASVIEILYNFVENTFIAKRSGNCRDESQGLSWHGATGGFLDVLDRVISWYGNDLRKQGLEARALIRAAILS